MKKRVMTAIVTMAMMVTVFAGCGNGAGTSGETLEGTSEEILAQVYENAELSADFREALNYYMTTPIDESTEQYILGTDEVDYTDSACSMPQMSSQAYQCVVLRLEADENVEEAKQQLLDNADPIKWLCVEAESVVVENVGDVILYVMADSQTADAIKTAFLALGE